MVNITGQKSFEIELTEFISLAKQKWIQSILIDFILKEWKKKKSCKLPFTIFQVKCGTALSHKSEGWSTSPMSWACPAWRRNGSRGISSWPSRRNSSLRQQWSPGTAAWRSCWGPILGGAQGLDVPWAAWPGGEQPGGGAGWALKVPSNLNNSIIPWLYYFETVLMTHYIKMEDTKLQHCIFWNVPKIRFHSVTIPCFCGVLLTELWLQRKYKNKRTKEIRKLEWKNLGLECMFVFFPNP